MCGVPGSGKSTWVRQRIGAYGGYHISRDEIRFAILDERCGDYFDYENEVIRTFVARINELLDSDEQGIDIYVDATHLTNNSRNQIMRQLHLENAYKIAVWMKVPLIVCLSRNEERTGQARVPRQTIVDMYERARRPSPKDFDEIWEIDFEGERIN
jgi:predicted kinase